MPAAKSNDMMAIVPDAARPLFTGDSRRLVIYSRHRFFGSFLK
ncbi:hypothetical protein B4113_2834 [Geobacillus sp. B4113_201601]|nr:hypothetical protein B4113_2834 [Geobacillus sp. B4113_201601]